MTKGVIERVAVTQEDRERAAEHYAFVQARLKNGHAPTLVARTIAELKAGKWDRDESVQSFAAHRTAALQSSGIEEMAEALEALISSADNTAWSANVGTMDSAIEAARTALARYRKGDGE